MSNDDVQRSWAALGSPMQHAIDLAWESTCAGSFGIGAVITNQSGEVKVLAPDPLFTGLDAIADVNEHIASNWPIVSRRPVDEWAVFSILLPTHLSSFWGTSLPRWTAALPATVAVADELAASNELVEAAAAHRPARDVVAEWWPRLSPCVVELDALN